MWARRWLIFFVFFPKIDRILLLPRLFRWRTLRWRRQQNGFPMKFASVAGSDMCTSEIICIQNAFCVEGNRIIYTLTHSYTLTQKGTKSMCLCIVTFHFPKRVKSIMPSLKGIYIAWVAALFFPSYRACMALIEWILSKEAKPCRNTIAPHTPSSSSTFAILCFFNFNKTLLHWGARTRFLGARACTFARSPRFHRQNGTHANVIQHDITHLSCVFNCGATTIAAATIIAATATAVCSMLIAEHLFCVV